MSMFYPSFKLDRFTHLAFTLKKVIHPTRRLIGPFKGRILFPKTHSPFKQGDSYLKMVEELILELKFIFSLFEQIKKGIKTIKECYFIFEINK
jgi:hypothetical protein